MSSPAPPHTVTVEIFIDAAWTDITSFVYQRSPITITRGAGSEQGRISPSNVTMVLDNRDGRFSHLHPSSLYYGKLRTGTQIRVNAASTFRVHAEVVSIRPRSDLSDKDRFLELEAAGIMQRLGQGADPVLSPPRRYYPTTSGGGVSIRAYWPCEDGPLARQIEPLVGSVPLINEGNSPQHYGSAQLAEWLAPTVQTQRRGATSGDGRFVGKINPVGFAGGWVIEWMVNGRASHGMRVPHHLDNYRLPSWGLRFTESTNSFEVEVPTGLTAPTGEPPVNQIFDGGPHHLRFLVTTSGGDAFFVVYIDELVFYSGTVTGGGPVPSPQYIDADMVPDNDGDGVTFGHIAFWYDTLANPAPVPSITKHVLFGLPGELAGDRLSRLCTENNVPLTLIGSASSTNACGPQYTDGLVNLMQETADVDGGVLYESVTSFGLTYRTRAARLNQAVTLTLDHAVYGHLAEPLSPPDDDQAIRNDVTVVTKIGHRARFERTTGPSSTSPPPPTGTGIGRFDTQISGNPIHASQASDMAGFAVHVGTWQGARYPTVKLNLSVLPLVLRADALAVTVGSRININNPPSWLPPDQIDLLVMGTRETLSTYQWDLELICVPYGPYKVAVEGVSRASSDGSTLAGSLTTSTTTFNVDTLAGPLWLDPTPGNYDLNIAGERVRLTDVNPVDSNTQQFVVTRSINGVVKSHTAGTPVELFDKAVWA